jgi:hypothetical protein
MAVAWFFTAGGASRVVAAEQKSRLAFLAWLQADCSSAGRTTVRVLEPPQHGKLTLEYGFD